MPWRVVPITIQFTECSSHIIKSKSPCPSWENIAMHFKIKRKHNMLLHTTILDFLAYVNSPCIGQAIVLCSLLVCTFYTTNNLLTQNLNNIPIWLLCYSDCPITAQIATAPREVSEAPHSFTFPWERIYYLKWKPRANSPDSRSYPKETTSDSLSANVLSLATRKKYSWPQLLQVIQTLRQRATFQSDASDWPCICLLQQNQSTHHSRLIFPCDFCLCISSSSFHWIGCDRLTDSLKNISCYSYF